ncbi:MAG: hypothetical protein HY700_03505 [Gemmatimonadetes bacterium]|nr:hypothetical protein [Gemmatimonadota bacterium]
MAVTARLLQRLQDVLGEGATDDLITWVDGASDRTFSQLRELADAYFARFDARLEQRLAEVKSELRAEFTKEFAALRVELAAQRGDLVKWMFIFWIGTIVPLAGLMVVLVRFWKP